ncbi:hypothetical protein Plim_1604 [Planctopirus limnophila DSM 3776]|uniref:Uncharacterized protein n=1 Tax=Planctopirus limnophila (strain ATCC 43296 / DSM 3776 / IFAM 1008 / Mu 290) TaxID=521674 RepID=D5SWT7_PLAL2|nr:hypothetical protein Plim_1604 [Planctopirus limnophila DSM 3776]
MSSKVLMPQVAPIEIMISTWVASPQEGTGRAANLLESPEIIRDSYCSACSSQTSFAFGTQVARGQAACATLRHCPANELRTFPDY